MGLRLAVNVLAGRTGEKALAAAQWSIDRHVFDFLVVCNGIFSIPAGVPFVDALAEGMLAEAGGDPLRLAEMTVLLPTRRAGRALREAFLRHHDQMCISTVTLMELIYGAEKSSNPSRNLADVEGFAARLEVLKYDQEAAAHTGQLRAELARLGKQIGPYDQMIAGHARSQGLIVVTNNRREFDRVPGLRVEDWVVPIV